MIKISLKKYWPYIILVLLIVMFFWKAIFLKEIFLPTDRLEKYYPWRYFLQQPQKVHNPVINDPIFFIHPMRIFTARNFLQGTLPLWNPHIFAGTPFHANGQSTLFSPFSILYYFFNPEVSLNLQIILQLLLAGISMFWLMKILRVGKFGALIAAIVFMFNGVFICVLEYGIFIGTAMWLPLIFLFLIKAVNEKCYRYAIISGIFMGIQFLSGFSYISFYTIIAFLIYFIFEMALVIRNDKTADFRPGISILLVLATGISLAALQLFPILELTRLCHREIAFPSWRAISLVIPYVINLFMPNLLSNHPQNLNWPYYGMKLLSGYTASPRAYIGIIPLILAFLCPWREASKEKRYFFVMAIFSFCFMFSHPILTPILKVTPIINKLKAHQRIDYLFVFFMAILAGYGADLLFNRRFITPSTVPRDVRTVKKIIRALWSILGLVIFILGAGNILIKFGSQKFMAMARSFIDNNYGYTHLLKADLYTLTYYHETLNQVFAQIKNSFSFTNINTFYPILITCAGIVLFKRYLKTGTTSFLKFSLLTLITVELFIYGINYNTTGPAKKVYPETPSIQFIKKTAGINRIMGVSKPGKINHYEACSQSEFPSSMPLPVNSAMVYSLYDVRGREGLYLRRYAEFIWAIDNKNPAVDIFDWTISVSNLNSPLLDLLNLKYVVLSPEDNRTLGNKFVKIFDADLKIYENKYALPRAFVVNKVKVIRKKEDILKELTSHQFNPHEYAIVEEDVPFPLVPETNIKQSRVAIVKYETNRVLIKADLDSNGFLILGDSYASGWKAYINGKKEKIFRTNYILRGVFLNKGRHNVEFVYKPESYYIGLWVTGITAIFIIFIFISKKNRDENGLAAWRK